MIMKDNLCHKYKLFLLIRSHYDYETPLELLQNDSSEKIVLKNATNRKKKKLFLDSSNSLYFFTCLN